ncbi:MAG: hypothetical protein KUG73_16515, partial [Pseudomonadales bacterium]|nr:hypothetical protein [Pseudomonadales bacterium]
MKEALELIQDELDSFRERVEFKSIEEKTEHSGLMNRYEMAIDRLKLCEKYECRCERNVRFREVLLFSSIP